MRFGVVFPNGELPTDAETIRTFSSGIEAIGYDHLHVYDHVLGAQRSTAARSLYVYSNEDAFHEPLVLFGYLAGVTAKVELVTGVLVMPQRQTALVAKQAAEVQLLSGGRLRLGVGVGWNPIEYQALGIDFATRGKRLDEQILVLRGLFAAPVIDYTSRFHSISQAGINPRPSAPPIWIGGMADAVLSRVGRLADGWIPNFIRGRSTESDPARFEKFTTMAARIREHARIAGRDETLIGYDQRIAVVGRAWDRASDEVERWSALGVTHVSFLFRGNGYKTVQEHLNAADLQLAACNTGSA